MMYLDFPFEKLAALHKEAVSVRHLLHLFNKGKALPEHLAQLGSKLRNGAGRMTNISRLEGSLPSVEVFHQPAYRDIISLFNSGGVSPKQFYKRLRGLDRTSMKAFEGLGSNNLESSLHLIPQMKKFQRDFRNLRPSVDALNRHTSDAAEQYAKKYTKMTTKPFLRGVDGKMESNPNFSEFSKSLTQPSYHRSLYNNPGLEASGMAVIEPGQTRKIYLYPRSEIPGKTKSHVLFHELGHVSDPNLHRFMDMKGMRTSAFNARDTSHLDWLDELNRQLDFGENAVRAQQTAINRAEAYAQGFGAHMNTNYLLGQRANMANKVPDSSLRKSLDRLNRKEFRRYGGSHTNTSLPGNYSYEPGDPLTRARDFMGHLIPRPGVSNPAHAILTRPPTYGDFGKLR